MSYSDSDLSSIEEDFEQGKRVYNEEDDEDLEEEEEEEEDDDEEDDEDKEDDNEDNDPNEIPEDEDDLPISSDDDENFKIDDDDDDIKERNEEVDNRKPKLKLKLKVAPPPSKTQSKKSKIPSDVYTDSEEGDYTRPPTKKQKQSTEQLLSKRKVGRPRKTATPVNYYDDNDDDVLSDSEDVIITPSLDDEGLSDDDEQERYKPVDVTKMTERQRAKLLDQEASEASSPLHSGTSEAKFLALSNNISKRKVLTEEENQLKKAEIARKRKNLIERKLEEEKQDTINKLLKRRAAKVSASSLKEDEEASGNPLDRPRRPYPQHPALFRWVSTKTGLQLRIPEPLVASIPVKSDTK